MNIPSSIEAQYLKLQFRRSIRLLKDNGIVIWLAIPLMLAVFVFVTFRLLHGYTFGEFIYMGLGLSLSTSIIDQRRNDFLQSFTTSYRTIRMLEHLVILIPFIIGLFLFHWYSYTLLLVVLGIAISFIDSRISLPRTIPTPFGARPFEFSRGFRGAILLIIGCYMLVPIGISVDNYNLAITSLAGIGLISGNYYLKPEPRFYVWIHSMTPWQFLFEKSKTIILYIFFCSLPIAIALLIYEPARYLSVVLMLLAIVGFTMMCMLAKYLAYPSEINIIAGFAMGFSILFPPLMLAIIPIFYFKAKQRLEIYLR